MSSPPLPVHLAPSPDLDPTRSRLRIPPSRLAAAGSVDASTGLRLERCYDNTLEIHDVLTSMQIEKDVPLYISAHWPAVDSAILDQIKTAIAGQGYKIVLSDAGGLLPREMRAASEFELALQASGC